MDAQTWFLLMGTPNFLRVNIIRFMFLEFFL